jgi:ketosteroid isomerase-like protein
VRRWLAFVIASGLLAPALLRGQQAKTETAPPEHPAHQELRALRDELVNALNSNDLDRLLRHVTEDVVATWQDAEVSRGHKGVRDYYNRMMVGADRIVESVTAKAEVDDLTRLYGQDKDTGLAFGRLEQDFKLTNGMNFHLSNRWTAHVAKDAGQWKLSAFHVSANLFDNAVLRTVTRQTMFWTGGIALPLGFVLGLIVARVFSRRRREMPT